MWVSFLFFRTNAYDHGGFEMMTKPVIKLVLADDEIGKLQKKLDIAIRALKKIDPENVPFEDFSHRGTILWNIARTALKEIEEVK